MSISLCHTDDIPDPGSKSFSVKQNDSLTDLFVVHKDGHFHGFINSCPHTGVNLEWQENQFLDMDNTYIQCSTHDALFEISTGHCVSGPCAGDKLSPVGLTVHDGIIFVDIPD